MIRFINILITTWLFIATLINPCYSQTLGDAFDISASGIVAQKIRLTIIAENVANITTLKDEATGLPYQKQYAVLEPSPKGVRISAVEKSNEPFGKYFDPDLPQADESGYYYHPNVDLPIEMVNLNYTELVYDANISVFKSTKTMYQQAIDILK
jgi:flagellar basal-body rod protein FlgC